MFLFCVSQFMDTYILTIRLQHCFCEFSFFNIVVVVFCGNENDETDKSGCTEIPRMRILVLLCAVAVGLLSFRIGTRMLENGQRSLAR